MFEYRKAHPEAPSHELHPRNFSGKKSFAGSQKSSDMIYYSLDPQFATLLFSVYSRHERIGFSVLPDSFCFATSVPSSNSILSYAHTVGLQLIALGEHYARFFSQVRAGSVIFLVGVGSLVCWKIWNYWNSGDASCGEFQSSPPPKTPSGGKKTTKTPSKSTKAFFASFLEEEFVHDFEEFEDEDPALIQRVIELIRLFVHDFILGKYFGPESPVENKPYPKVPNGKTPELPCLDDTSPLTSEYSGRPYVTRKDLADTSGAYQGDDDEGSSFSSECEESLPFDGAAESSSRETKRLKKRRHNRRLERSHCVDISSNGLQKNDIQNDSFDSPYLSLNPKHLTSNRSLNSLETDISSSETSPRDRVQESAKATARQSRACSFRRQDGERVAKGEETSKQQKSFRSVSASGKPYFYANWNSDEEWDTNDGETPNREGLPTINPKGRSLSREISLSDLMGRLRKKASLRSLSRDNSLSSRMSDILRREDSISSNLSDFACSECSEISLDLSLKDDTFADLTITSLADIEDELNTLKSSVLEMDEEVLKFSSRPNPYLLKTTFSDYSLDSDSRPESALDFMSYRKSRSRSGSVVDSSEVSTSFLSETIKSSINDPLDEENSSRKSTIQSSKGNSSHSIDKEKSNEEWTSSRRIRVTRRRSSTEGVVKLVSQDDVLPSLEWDNDGFKQYEDDLKPTEEKSEYEMGQSLDRHKFLPDHSSLELDLEKELLSSGDCNPTFSGRDILAGTLSPCVSPLDSLPSHAAKRSSEHIGVSSEKHKSLPQRRQPPTSLPLKSTTESGNQMTISIDSAIQSAPGSRSGSSSPVSHMTQSMMSSGIVTSWSEALETSLDAEDFKNKKFWRIDESGYVEGENACGGSVLSPVYEVGERESSCSDNGIKFCESPKEFGAKNSVEEIEINSNNTEANIINNNNNNSNNMGNAHTSTGDGCPGSLISFSSHIAVGDKQDLLSYAQTEWQGTTTKAKTIREGYKAIPNELKLYHLRKIRGDNYCGIRAALYQILASGIPVPNSYQVYTRLLSEVSRGAVWLKDYTFGRRLAYPKEQVVQGFRECLESLDKFTLDLAGCDNIESAVVSRLNSNPRLDIQLCEAAKLHMLACALDLYKLETMGDRVPLFGMIMFARQSCLSPRDFMINHLNAVGDSAGLEQIEMFLLGHSLQVTLQVVRPSSYGGEDYICFYPDENIGIWSEVNLVAEDDRHYNVLVK